MFASARTVPNVIRKQIANDPKMRMTNQHVVEISGELAELAGIGVLELAVFIVGALMRTVAND